MNEEELGCFNAIVLIESYATSYATSILKYTDMMQCILELNEFHSMSVGNRIIKESKNG